MLTNSSDKNKSNKMLNILFSAFLLLNSLKLTLFNFIMLPNKDAWIFCYKFVFFLLLSALIFLAIFKLKKIYVFLIFYIVECIYIFSLLSYFGYFHNYLHIMQSAVLFTEGVESIGHMTIPINLTHLCILIDLIPFIYMIKYYKVLQCHISHLSKNLIKPLLVAFAAILVISEAVYAQGGQSIGVIIKDYTTYEDVFVARFGTLASDGFNTILNSGGESYIKHIEYGKDIQYSSQSQPQNNIIAIQVESMDSNIINKTWNGSYVAPYLHSLTENAVYYPYALSYHMAGGTSDAEFSIINSVQALSIFPSMKLKKYTYPNSVAKQFNDSSYTTYAFHGNIGNYYNRDVAFKKMGFDNFFDINTMNYKDSTGWGVPDHVMFDYVLDALEDVDGPFFSYIITITSHMPFNNTESYYSTNAYNDVKNTTVKNYFTSISYVDQSIHDFVEAIQQRYPNTYIFIYGDHTPDLNEAEYTQASYTYEGNYFEFVPVIIITPDGLSMACTNNSASFLDIAPTMLNAAGIKYEYKSNGIDLLNAPKDLTSIPYKGSQYDRSWLINQLNK